LFPFFQKHGIYLALVAHACNPSYLEAEIGRIMAQGQPRQIVLKTSSPKITRAKWTGGVAQVVV
jgi:hypothetical protein